jgi:hypothetical protein
MKVSAGLSGAANISAASPKLRVSILVADARAAYTVQDIGARASTVSPVVAAAYALPAAQIDYIDLAVGAILDTSGRFKFIPDSVLLLDAAKFDLAKALVDAYTTLDSTSVAALKFLADGFAMNDGSEAVDGSTYSFAKGISNVTFVSDATATAALKLLQDNQTLQDLAAKVADKSLVDDFSLTDDETVSALKGLSDSVMLEDTLATLLLFLRNFADDVTVADADARVYSLPKIEQVAVADNDFIDWTKSLAHNVTPADVSVFLAEKPFSESLVASEAKTLSFSAARVESVTVPDVGLLSVQDYCDLSYFAEDYVGFSQSF